MSVRHVVSALLLFAAAVGWAFTSPPDRLDHASVRAVTSACVLLGVGTLLAGLHGRPDHELS